MNLLGDYIATPFPNKPPKVKIINIAIPTMPTATDREETTETRSWQQGALPRPTQDDTRSNAQINKNSNKHIQ